MAPQSNPETPPAVPNGPATDSPSADDLLALIPDMELLETLGTRRARGAHCDCRLGVRSQDGAPLLSDPVRPTTVRTQAATAVINDDPYADLMPELEAYEEPVPPARPVTRAVPAPQSPPAAPRPMAAPERSAAAPAPSTPRPKPAVVVPRPAVAARPAPAPARKPPNPENVAVP